MSDGKYDVLWPQARSTEKGVAMNARFADLGWGKKEIRRHLFQNTEISARWLEHYPLAVAGQEFPLADIVKRGSAPALYAESDDPQRMVPMLLKEEWTNIVVAGDPGRNQSRIYINNQRQGAPVARRIGLPADWRQSLKRVQHQEGKR